MFSKIAKDLTLIALALKCHLTEKVNVLTITSLNSMKLYKEDCKYFQFKSEIKIVAQ